MKLVVTWVENWFVVWNICIKRYQFFDEVFIFEIKFHHQKTSYMNLSISRHQSILLTSNLLLMMSYLEILILWKSSQKSNRPKFISNQRSRDVYSFFPKMLTQMLTNNRLLLTGYSWSYKTVISCSLPFDHVFLCPLNQPYFRVWHLHTGDNNITTIEQ